MALCSLDNVFRTPLDIIEFVFRESGRSNVLRKPPVLQTTPGSPLLRPFLTQCSLRIAAEIDWEEKDGDKILVLLPHTELPDTRRPEHSMYMTKLTMHFRIENVFGHVLPHSGQGNLGMVCLDGELEFFG